VIVVRLMGGLGNQLFQYAAGRRLASRHGVELVLDLGWFRHEAQLVAAPRRFELEPFGFDNERIELDPNEIRRWESDSRSFFRRRRLVIRQRDGDLRVDARVLEAGDDVVLVGYWQSEQYFLDVEEAIRSEVGRPSPSDGRAVAVHIRRGDYVAHAQTHAVHGVLPVEYYNEALHLVARRVDGAQFLAFSDDPEWVKAELGSILPLEVATAGSAHDDLVAMARCRHHVIANSSFSWWGAWLGERDDSVVVAPSRWFADPALDSGAIVPDRWVRL
jgi:hypothetical protein